MTMADNTPCPLRSLFAFFILAARYRIFPVRSGFLVSYILAAKRVTALMLMTFHGCMSHAACCMIDA